MFAVLFTGEDKVSSERHCKRLNLEVEKHLPNMHVVNELVKLTFPMRCQDIIENTYI